MTTFKSILAQPGQPIRAEDWNKMQEGLVHDIAQLEALLAKVKEYVDNMAETVLLSNIESTEGKAYGLNDPLPGEVGTYQTNVLGLITKQWLPARQGAAEICRFGLTDFFEHIYYWAAAEKGNKKTLEIGLEYVDGTNEKIKDLYIHDRRKLAPKGTDNPYVEYLLSPNEWVWYKYKLTNPHPDKEVRYINFRNINPESTPRIGNILHLRSKIKPITD